MKIFNTITKQVEPFIPRSENRVQLFVCGPTVYGPAHLGHAKTYTQFDFIAKYLAQHFNVQYLMNITDIDDKIIIKAQQLQTQPLEIAREFEQLFFKDMSWLGNRVPDIVARSHDHIEEVVNQIERLIDIDAAYETKNGWYFDLTKFERTTDSLTKRELLPEEVNSYSRVSTDSKRNPNDFVLWKFSKPGEPSWETVLGAGRPGWHIEDTAITEKFFGQQYDIHGGATDLIFPHHEAEIIQMETLSGQKLANYWMHTGLLEVDGQKMGKSLNNFISIEDLKKTHNPLTLRLFFLSRHYRSTVEINNDILAETDKLRKRVEELYHKTNNEEDSEDHKSLIKTKRKLIHKALEDDFNTPVAFAELYTFVRHTNNLSKIGNQTRSFLEEINSLFETFDFGTELSLPLELTDLIALRDKARLDKKWDVSDKLRIEIQEKFGGSLKDTSAGTVWMP